MTVNELKKELSTIIENIEEYPEKQDEKIAEPEFEITKLKIKLLGVGIYIV